MKRLLLSTLFLTCTLYAQDQKKNHNDAKAFVNEMKERSSHAVDMNAMLRQLEDAPLAADLKQAQQIRGNPDAQHISAGSSLQQSFHHEKSQSAVQEAVNATKEQLQGSRMQIDPITDPMFINANNAVKSPMETLNKQEMQIIDDSQYEMQNCVETRSEIFTMSRVSRINPYYKRFHVHQFYNSCPNHPGWGKKIVQGCQAIQKRHLFSLKRRQELDYQEAHGMEWEHHNSKELEELLALNKCRLDEERISSEDKAPRRINVEHYKKEETLESQDWNISPDSDHREETSVLKEPKDFNLESFSKIQVFKCAITPANAQNTCQPLRERGGIEVSSLCQESTAGTCSAWAKVYKVPKADAHISKITQRQVDKSAVFNIDGLYDKPVDNLNNEHSQVISQFAAINESAKAIIKPGQEAGIGPENLTVFNGENLKCVSQGGKFSRKGCPWQKGNKKPEEIKLAQLYGEGKCMIVGTYEDDDGNNIGTIIGQKREVTSFCCYESVLARVVHEAALRQGLKSIGSVKSPRCSELNITSLQELDWSGVDLEPFMEDIKSRITLNTKDLLEKSSSTVQQHFQNQMRSFNRGVNK